MSYGKQINIFKAKAEQYGRHWQGIVLCHNNVQLKMAAEDAQDMLKGVFNPQFTSIFTESGARLKFRVCKDDRDIECAMRGHEYTHIIWITPPTRFMSHLAESRLRSRGVPKDDLRHEQADF